MPGTQSYRRSFLIETKLSGLAFGRTRHPTDTHLSGGLRFFAGNGSGSADLLPAQIQQSLLEMAMKHGDVGNLKRARKLFTKAASDDVSGPDNDLSDD